MDANKEGACMHARTLDMLASAYANEFVYCCLKEDFEKKGNNGIKLIRMKKY